MSGLLFKGVPRGPGLLFSLALLGLLLAAGRPARTAVIPNLGLVADDTHQVTRFDADTLASTGSLALPGPRPDATGDPVILADQSLGFVTDYGSRVWVIDMTGPAPVLAAGTNPIPISNPGEDLALTADQKYLLVCDGDGDFPLSVVDIAARAEIGTFAVPNGVNSVDVRSDGSVLITSFFGNRVRRLAIDGAGTLTDTGESLGVYFPENVYHAPGNAAGIVVGRFGFITSFTIPGLTQVDTRTVGDVEDFAMAGAFTPDGTRFFVRTSFTLQAWDFDPATGALAAAPAFTIPLGFAEPYYGIDQVAVHPNGTRVYVGNGGSSNAVLVFDTATGAPVGPIVAPGGIVSPTGIYIVRAQGSISGTKYDDLNGDGIRQMGEPGLGGWEIQLDRDADGTVDDTATTDMNGDYTFTGLTAGTYRVREVLKPDYQQTSDNPADVVLGDGQTVTGIDFGNFELFDICVVKFHDVNRDGIRQMGEPGLPGVTIFLDQNGSDTFEPGEPSGSTDGNGEFCFPDLGPGSYRVREVIPSPALLWRQTTPNPAPFDGQSGQDVDLSFGNKGLARMVVSPGALTFGTIPRNTSTERSWVVYNTGAGNLMINVPHEPRTVHGIICPDFQLLNGQGGAPLGPPGVQNLVIPPGQARVFWVRFRPTRLGFQSCYFRVQSVFPFDDPSRPFQDVNVSGTGR
jgi:DNA-binding beta-propeller fold protein YncE